LAITSLDAFLASAKQRSSLFRTASRTAVATGWFSVFDLAGDPGAGVLAGTSTAAGVVPTDAMAGCPLINTFGGGNAGYLAQIEYASTVACRIALFDLLFKAGAYAFNANTALSAQPSFSGRVPGGTDYTATEIWVEQVTAATGNQAVNVTYTNQSGTTGRTTGATGIGAAPTLGRCWQLPFQSGDTGVQVITNVAGSVATVGTFNVLVLRRLASMRVGIANFGDTLDLLRLGMPQVFDTTAYYMLIAADSTATGLPDLEITTVNG